MILINNWKCFLKKVIIEKKGSNYAYAEMSVSMSLKTSHQQFIQINLSSSPFKGSLFYLEFGNSMT